MAPNKFEPGDIVRVRSGGPSLTIAVVQCGEDHPPMAMVVWMNDKGDLQVGNLPEACLVRIQ